jgi:hypothetical protein
MAFTLQIAGGAPQLFSQLGLTGLQRRQRSQQAGSFAFTATGALMDGNALAAEGTVCTVYSNGVPFFTGRLHQIPRKGAGAAESIDYQLLDAWHDFERNVYQQQWNVITSVDESGSPTTATQYRSECILGMDLNGDALTNGQVIQQIVAWAVSVGAYCQLGTIGVAAPVPFDEVTDLPCAECIRKMLRWSPDAVAWMDYSTLPPTFNVTRRAGCRVSQIPFTGLAEHIDIKALPDLLAPSVVIRYLQENKVDGTPAVVVIPDVWPSGATGTEYGALVQSVRLAGSNSTYQKQPVVVTPIPTVNSANGGAGGPSDDPTIAWWRRKVAWLQQFSTDRLSITNVYGVVDAGQLDASGDGSPLDDDISLYPNELISGSVASWMDCTIAATTWSALVSYVYPGSQDVESRQALSVFGLAAQGGSVSGTVYIACHARATSAVTQTYAQLTNYDQAEPVPSGLAEYLYGSLYPLQYDGSYTFVSQEVGAWNLGTVLNLSGGRPEWSTMNALLQEVHDDLDAGRTTLRFGAAGHLAMRDLMEQLRASRSRTTSSHIRERQTGVPGDAPEVDGPAHTATGGSSTTPSVPAVSQDCPFQVYDASGTSNLAVSFNSYSYLFNSPDINDTNTIDGLDTSGLAVAIGDYIWIEIDYNSDLTLDGEPSIGSGPTWPSADGESQYDVDSSEDQPFISAWYVPVAKILAQDDPTPGTDIQSSDGSQTGRIVQLLDTHLILTAWAVDGMAASVPSAWTGTA